MVAAVLDWTARCGSAAALKKELRMSIMIESLENRRLLSATITSIQAVSAVANTPVDTVVRGEKATLTALGVSASGEEKISSVVYFVDQNDDGLLNRGDTIIGASGNAARDYAITRLVDRRLDLGAQTVSAVARIRGKSEVSPTVNDTLTLITSPPTIKNLVAAPKKVKAGKNFTLNAAGTKDKDSTIAKVEFWFDVNNNGVIDGEDQLDFTDTDPKGGWKDLVSATSGGGNIAAGTYKFLAQATDSDGAVSNVVSADITVV
jgi:hypothetical protein